MVGVGLRLGLSPPTSWGQWLPELISLNDMEGEVGTEDLYIGWGSASKRLPASRYVPHCRADEHGSEEHCNLLFNNGFEAWLEKENSLAEIVDRDVQRLICDCPRGVSCHCEVPPRVVHLDS